MSLNTSTLIIAIFPVHFIDLLWSLTDLWKFTVQICLFEFRDTLRMPRLSPHLINQIILQII